MNTHNKLFLIFLAFSANLAHAATYYVDSNAGNDLWSGTQATAGGGIIGPWQSLGRVSSSIFLPGDNILLACGGVWYETLKPISSGTASNPITIGAYPATCSNKPVISGTLSVPAQNWIQDTGNIYKISGMIDLIASGNFENGLGDWTQWSPQGDSTLGISSNCAPGNGSCLTFTSGSQSSIAISNRFALQGKQQYVINYAIKAPLGSIVYVVVRRNAPPWDSVGYTATIVGIGAWTTVATPFTASATLPGARVDFVVPAGVNIGLDKVKVNAALANVKGVFNNGQIINVAHFPNRGYDPLRPDSVYFSIAADANLLTLSSGAIGSSYLTTGIDLAALSHPTITVGTGILLRPNAWTLETRKVASVSGSQLVFDSATVHPIQKNWGYFLYGQRWMLDSPGEWSFDPASNTLAVWMPDSQAPGARVSVGLRDAGIDVSGLSNLRINDIVIQNQNTGVRLKNATNVVLYRLNITDILGLGVDAVGSVNSGIESSQIKRTMNSAIAASHFGSIGFHAYDNLLTDIGVTVTNGQVTSLPSTSAAAIDTGLNSNIRNNAIYRTGNIGIYPLAGSSVSNNYIENACMVTDDCGAIYTSGADSTGITIANNTINHVVGGLAGKPINIPTQAQGIYLDELASGNTISGNTVVDADNGVQIHNAANNLIQNNTFYANRLHHVWLQEGSSVLNSGGDIHDNSVLSNRMFLTSPSPAVFQQTLLQKTDTNRFAQYNYNRYFTFLYPTISTESWPVGSSLYTLPKWQTAVTPNTVPRSLDINGTEVNSASLGYAAFLTLSGNIVPNGNFSTGTYGWSSYSAVSPAGKMTLGTCTTVGTCLTYTSGGSPSLMNSPNFSVQASQWYKVTFDLKTGASGQTVYVVVRRGGGGSNGYEWLMNAPYQFVGTTGWQRYSFLFKSSETIKANDPLTGDLGARVDFEQMQYGQNVSVGNLEIVSLSAVDATLHSNILLNPTISAMNLNCPDGSLSATCNQYVRFSDNQPVIWPYTLQPYSSEIIYTRDSKLIDADGDGIPDSQDKCSATPALQAVNAAGCALGQ